ncbi:MAG: choice-of-anchor J domain-containing protein, partial [Syntrophothermus sp.]
VGTSGTYSDGTFVGQDGSTWSYFQCRSDRAIVAPSPCLGKNRTPAAKVESGTIANGCGTLNFDYKQGYSTAVNMNVYVNGVLVANVVSPGGSADTSIVHQSGPILVNQAGSFVISFQQADNASSGQVTIDNISWTANNTVLPEPTNYPTAFTATPSNFKITLHWVDATGTQPPTAYLIKASSTNNITAPVDGTPVTDDPDLSDGSAALNVLQGAQTCYFSNLASNTPYYFVIYPYTNSGSIINYKNDGTAPSVSATTPNSTIIHQQNFNGFSLAPWTKPSIVGAQEWTIDSIHGTSASACAKISGYAGSANENEDWLISPAMNFTLYNNETLSFENAYNYQGDPLAVKISTNYDGSGDPNDFNWTDLTATWSAGGWAWTPSGDIDISGYNGTAVFFAFNYLSNTTAASTWEVDDVLVLGTPIVGTPEKNTREFSCNPNPASGHVVLGFSNDQVHTVSVINLLGSTVLQKTFEGNTAKMDISSLSSGAYLVQVITGGETVTKKLIVR